MIIPSEIFPPVEQSDADGLLAIGGILESSWIIDALVHGIFPWPLDSGFPTESENTKPDFYKELQDNLYQKYRQHQWNGFSPENLRADNNPMLWWSPDPRTIFDLNRIHISRRVYRILRQRKFRVTFDQAFPQVMLGCAFAKERATEGTWITREIFTGYCHLFEQQLAHSVEVWLDKSLVGGVYGVAINGFFDAESMFHTRTDASNVALATLLLHLKEQHFKLVDIQMITPHTQRFGAMEISRSEYMERLDIALNTSVGFYPGQFISIQHVTPGPEK